MDIACALTDSFDEQSLDKIHQSAFIDLGFEGLFVKGIFIRIGGKVDLGIGEEFQKFIFDRDGMFHHALDILEPAIADLIFFHPKVAGDDRDIAVGGVGGDDDQFILLFIIEPIREHHRLDHEVPVRIRKDFHVVFDKIDPFLCEITFRDMEFPEGIEVCDFPEDRIMVDVKVIDQDLAQIPAGFLIFVLPDLDRLFESLIIDYSLLQECIADFISYVNVCHRFNRNNFSSRIFRLFQFAPGAVLGWNVAVSDETSVSSVRTTMMIRLIQSWIKSIAFRILYVVSFS